MCFIFHDWGKWGELKSERWQRVHHWTPLTSEKIIYSRYFQERFCQECGKYEKRYISED